MACMFCKQGCLFCDKERVSSWYPSWFKVNKSIPKTWIANVNKGLHPHGRKLSSNKDAKCANCVNLYAKRMGKTYYKCIHGPGSQSGQLSDIRLSWRACVLWEGEK